MYYVYELIDPRSALPFYVGKGKNNRMHEHERDARKGIISAKCNTIREIWADGLDVAKRVVSRHGEEQAAYDAEAAYIEKIGLSNLTNVIPGGGLAKANAETAAKDASRIEVFAFLLHRLPQKGNILVKMGEQTIIDVRAFYEASEKALREIVQRRGRDWVAKKAKKYKVEINFVEAV